MEKMRWSFLVFGSLACMGLMSQDIPTQRLHGKLSQIGFAHNGNLEKVESENGSIVCGIPDVLQAHALPGPWELKYSNIAIHQDGDEVEKEVSYRKGAEFIGIEYYLVERNFQKIESRFFGFMAGGTSPKIPGERGPADIGDISVAMPRANGGELIFLKSNLCVRISSSNTQVDVNTLARWIQAHLVFRPWTEYSKIVPRPVRDTLGSGNIRQGQALLSPMSVPIQGRVDQAIEIKVEMPLGSDSGGYLFKCINDDSMFKCSWNNKYWTLTPLKAGIGKFKYLIVDKQTLLSYAYEVGIDVQP
jgi:hypothetical protein